MSIKKKSLLACAVALALVMSITTAFATSAKPQEAEPAKSEVQTTAKKPEASAPVKKTDAPVPAKETEEPAPMEKPEAPAPEKEDAPSEAAPEAKPAAAETGTPFYAAGSGTVKEVGSNAQDGNFIRIQHSQSMETFYAHCASVLVKTGDAVENGQTIATVGTTGPRFRFEFLVNGVAEDSVAYSYERHTNIGDGYWSSVGVNHGEEEDYTYLGNPIVVIQDGTVLAAGVKNYGKSSERGPYVQIQYESGYSTSFYGCDKVLVKTGDSVKTGDVIAYAGVHGSGMLASPQLTESEFEIEASWKEWADENLVNGDYPRNSRGETYGNTKGFSYLGYEPDLIGVVVPYTHEEGYVTKEDMHYPPYDPENPDLGNAFDNWWEENHFTGLVLPMYDSEHNLIGEWIAQGDNSGKVVTIAEARAAQEKGFPNANGSQFIDRGPHYDTVEEAREAMRNGEI